MKYINYINNNLYFNPFLIYLLDNIFDSYKAIILIYFIK